MMILSLVSSDKREELKGSIRNEKLDVLSSSMDQRGVAIMREGTATRVNLDESGATCDGNPKVISSPLVSPTATVIMPPRGPYDIDVAATFGVPLTTVGDVYMLINDIEAGKHDELLYDMTNDDRMETLDALGTICNSIQADRNVILNESDSMVKGVSLVKAPNDPNADDNIHVVEKVGLEAVLEGGPWLIHKSLIILKKWSMDTRLLKEELTRILIWVKLHDVPIYVFKEDGISLIATFIGKPVILDSYTSSMCNDSWGRSSFSRCLIQGNSLNKDNITSSNSFSALNVEEEVENVYDETANLFTKTSRSSFTAAAN
ncbi:zinc knuckle CX2CX4HX4C containing protein [Tanacetum coccineum]